MRKKVKKKILFLEPSGSPLAALLGKCRDDRRTEVSHEWFEDKLYPMTRWSILCAWLALLEKRIAREKYQKCPNRG